MSAPEALDPRRRVVAGPEYASVDGIVGQAMAVWRPPPRLSLSEWADRYFYLSPESAAEPGRWHTLPYQREMMDAFTDPRVYQVSVMKSARVGWTEVVKALVGYCIHQDPTTIMVVQPTVDDAKGFSKEGIAPMLRDCPALSQIVFEEAEEVGPRDSGNTILHKKFPGGVLSLVGANSGTGLRRVARRVVLFDEVDAYPPSAGSDGDPIKLGMRRAETYWNRKIGAGSTPLVAGSSRIEQLFEAGDMRRYFVPCPHCGHKAPFVFRGDAGHAMTWPEGKPREAFFTCKKNGCVIEHKDKRAMVAAGEWRASQPFTGHASFHIWAAYSYSPNATWGQIAEEFLEAKESPERLKTFVNTWLGETWKERGEAPDWERLYQRRERYEIGTVPQGVLELTCGVDVQKDRWVYEVVGWGAGKESWSVDAGVIMGDTSNEAEWVKLDGLLERAFPAADGTERKVRMMGVDAGYNTQVVYNWCRRYLRDRVVPVKGTERTKALIGAPSSVGVTVSGRKVRGMKLFLVGADIAKSELYGLLRLPMPEPGAPFPPGWCHFPEYGQDFFKQLTAEHLVSHVDGRGFTRHQWEKIPGRENHWLDTRVYARAVASLIGLDRMKPMLRRPMDVPHRIPAGVIMAVNRETPGEPLDREEIERAAVPPAPKQRKPGGFLAGSDSRFRVKGWLKR